MQIKHILLGVVAAMAALSLSSCLMIMDSGEDGESIIYVECLQGMSDTTAISVIATAPKFGYDESRVPSDMDVTLKAGGREIPLTNAGVEVEMFPKGAYYTTEKIEGGQTLEITVAGGGFKPVRAITYKPKDIKPFGVNVERTVIYDEDLESYRGERVVKMEIMPDDPDIIDHYYALVFEQKVYNIKGEAQIMYPAPILHSNGFYSTDFGDALVVSVACSPWSIFSSNYSYISDSIVPTYLWRGASLMKDGKITVYFHPAVTNGACEMRVHLMEVSPEFYRYAKSLENRGEVSEALAPFFPSSYSFTNIEGGCGIFGAVSRYDGEWMIIPD